MRGTLALLYLALAALLLGQPTAMEIHGLSLTAATRPLGHAHVRYKSDDATSNQALLVVYIALLTEIACEYRAGRQEGR